jgi:tRNA-uridine 2-sulfurtransferase
MSKKRVLIGMSGGVDSTVSTMMLLEQGYDVEGVYMKLHSKPGYHEIHMARAQKAADHAGVKLHILDLQDKFKEDVYMPFIKIYEEGKTPNPCALCNRNIKFGAMVDFADSIGADYVATGHYIQTDGKNLIQAQDDTKDQSYFLFYINKDILPRLLFPLGDKLKTDIKEIAASIEGLESFASQAESSEICFVETVYTDVLKKHIEVDVPGDVVDKEGNVIGTHKGYMHYTIGKRRGFDVPSALIPHYVTGIIPAKNQIVVGLKEELECFDVEIENLNMFSTETSFDTTVKLRYRTKAVACHVEIEMVDGIQVGRIKLHESVPGVAAGQAAVFYDGAKLIGGGWIK